MHSWDKLWVKKIQKDQKNATATSEEPGLKNRILSMLPALNTT